MGAAVIRRNRPLKDALDWVGGRGPRRGRAGGAEGSPVGGAGAGPLSSTGRGAAGGSAGGAEPSQLRRALRRGAGAAPVPPAECLPFSNCESAFTSG